MKKMLKKYEPHQFTLSREVSCSGIGLHTGRTIRMVMRPAPANTGVVFYRSDIDPDLPVNALAESVVDTRLATTIGCGEARISTTEHLLAAVRCLGIDNVRIDIDGPEVPIMDGSAGPFVFLLKKKAGLKKQKKFRRLIKVTREISWEDGDSSVRILPYDGFKVTCDIEFDHNLIRSQSFSFDVDSNGFAREISRARTFGFMEDIEMLRKNGLALGGSLDNAVVVGPEKVMNAGGLRFEDEFVRHKALDLIGDLSLLGAPLVGHVVAKKSGHGQHLAFMKEVAAARSSWEYLEFARNREGNLLTRAIKNSGRAAGNVVVPFLVPGRPTMPQGAVSAVGRNM